MSETVPEPTRSEQVARLAAEAALESRPDPAPQLAAVLDLLQKQSAALGSLQRTAADLAGQLAAREAPAPADTGQLAAIESALSGLTERIAGLETKPAPDPGPAIRELHELCTTVHAAVVNIEYTLKEAGNADR